MHVMHDNLLLSASGGRGRLMSTPAALGLGPLPSRRASAACGSLTTETIVEEVNHWQKIRDLVSGRKQQQQQQPPLFKLIAADSSAAHDDNDDGGGSGGGLNDLIAVAEKLEQLKETDFGSNFRKYSIASQGVCDRVLGRCVGERVRLFIIHETMQLIKDKIGF